MQPATDWVVPPWQVRVAEPLTVQVPVQVMLQVPAVHATLEPAPTVCVHCVPRQVTLQLGPQVPVQVDPDAQLKLHPEVLAEQVSNAQEVFEGQLHDVPEQVVPQLDNSRVEQSARARAMSLNMDGLLEKVRGRPKA
jgi:hypothetical protein